MPPRDPNRAVDDFLERSSKSHDRYIRLFDAVEDASDVQALRRGLAVDAAFRLGSEWELFQHGWHIAAISTDPSKLIEEKLKAVNSKLASIASATSRVLGIPTTMHSGRSRLTLDEIAELLDPNDRNISFSDLGDWLKSAYAYLPPKYIAKVQAIQGDPEDACLVELLKALRNAIAHGSSDSKARLTRAVRQRAEGDAEGLVGVRNDPLVRGESKYAIRDIGTYLNRWTGFQLWKGQAIGTRFALIHDRLKDIASGMKI